MRSIGGTLKDLRINKQITQEELANDLNNLYNIKINKGMIYTFKQKKNQAKIYSAYARFKLYQGKNKNYSTKVISRYAHKILSISGGISIGKTPSIEIGWGYDESKQLKAGLIR